MIEYVKCSKCGEEWTKLKGRWCPQCLEEAEKIIGVVRDTKKAAAGDTDDAIEPTEDTST